MLIKIINIFAVLVGISLFSILTFLFYKNASKNLAEYSYVEGRIINGGITDSENNKKKEIFYLQLSNIKKEFSIFSITQNYKELQEQIKIGDNVKLYYENSNSEKNKYFEVIQLEKGNETIINHSKHKLIYYGLAILCLLANIYILLMIFHYIKYGEFDNPIPPIF